MTCIDFIQKLFVSDAQSNEQDGGAVAIHGDLAIVSAGGRDIGANVNQGAAYIFHRSDTLWIKEATLTASDGGSGDFFSHQPGTIVNAVDIFGNTAIVGAFSRDSDVQPNAGSAYIFTRSDNGTWTQTKQLFASDSASDMQFGISVAINDQFAAVAARKNGAVYIFEKSDVTWNYTQKLISSDTVAIGYGQIALYETTLIAGATSDASNRGSAYIFTYDGAQWVQQTKLIPNDGASGDQFGISVDVFCDYAIVGSWLNASSTGAAYTFVRSDTTWTQQQKLTASDTNPNKNNARFGTSVTIDGCFIAVGASRAASSGKTYLFQRTGSTWSQTDGFHGSDPENTDHFGFSCALSYPYLIVGTPQDDTPDTGPSNNKGSAYIYKITCPNCTSLSDIQFHALSTNSFEVTGYQFSQQSGTRFVSAAYMAAPVQTQSFTTNGLFQFAFSNTPISDGAPVTITVYRSDCSKSDVAMVASQHQIIAQGTLNVEFPGSLLNFNLVLPPELSITLPITSDVRGIFSDICAFAQNRPCQEFLAGLLINEFSDPFCSDAVITRRPEVIVVSCSDNILHLDDDDGHFTFSITNFMSDIVFVRYDDASCHVSDVTALIGGGFSCQASDTHFIWVNPCDSDAPNAFTNLFNHPFLAINAQSDIVDIGFINCSGTCRNPTSDLLYVSQLKAATIKLGNYLEANYSDYPNHISDQCRVLYLGSITAHNLTLDMNTRQMIFNNFSIPFSDVSVC